MHSPCLSDWLCCALDRTRVRSRVCMHWGGFRTPTSNSVTPAAVQEFSSILTPSTGKAASHPTGEGSAPEATLHFRGQSRPQFITRASDRLAVNQRFPQPPPQIRVICYSSSQNSRKPIYSQDYRFITKEIKDYESTAR